MKIKVRSFGGQVSFETTTKGEFIVQTEKDVRIIWFRHGNRVVTITTDDPCEVIREDRSKEIWLRKKK